MSATLVTGVVTGVIGAGLALFGLMLFEGAKGGHSPEFGLPTPPDRGLMLVGLVGFVVGSLLLGAAWEVLA